MQLLNAKVIGQPRTVNTKQGEKYVINCLCCNGESHTIWRPANDSQVMRLIDGERVQVGINSSGKVSLVETAYSRAEEQAQPRSMGFTVPTESKPSKRVEVDDYIDRLGNLYSRCYQAASSNLSDTPLQPAEVKDVATTLFIQTTRHFTFDHH
jgi:hypothetical protein